MLKDRLNAYLDDLSQNATAATVASHRSTLTRFVDECQSQGLTADELDTQVAAKYLANISADYRTATIRGKISTLTNFLAYVRGEHPEIIRWKIQSKLKQQTDDPTNGGESDSEELARIEDLKVGVSAYLDYVRNRAYGTREHVATEIAVATGCRLRSLRELDVEDLQLDAGTLEVSIPEKYAVSQNDLVTTRTVTLTDECVQAVKTYLEHDRIPFETDDGAKPLFTTQHGRVSATTLRRLMQAIIDAAWSGTTTDEADLTLAHTAEGDSKQLSPRDIRRYYIAQLIEE
jgi:site-specific recombinase XerD